MVDDIGTGNRIIWLVYVVVQQLVAVVIAYAISILFHGDLEKLWLWHRVLTPIGVVLFMFEGIHIFNGNNHLAFGVRKATLNNIHGYIMATGLTFMSIGVPFAIATNDEHFTSVHGIVGLTAWILCLISGIIGILTNYSHYLKTNIRPIYLRFSHTLLGLSAFICSLASAALGFYNLKDEGPTAIPTIMTLIGLTGLAVLLNSGCTVLTNTKTVFSS